MWLNIFVLVPKLQQSLSLNVNILKKCFGHIISSSSVSGPDCPWFSTLSFVALQPHCSVETWQKLSFVEEISSLIFTACQATLWFMTFRFNTPIWYLRIQLKLNTALLSTVRPCAVRGVTSHISHIYKGINAMWIIRGPIKPCIFWVKIILAIFLAKTRPDKTIFSALTNLTTDFDFELSNI